MAYEVQMPYLSPDWRRYTGSQDSQLSHLRGAEEGKMSKKGGPIIINTPNTTIMGNKILVQALAQKMNIGFDFTIPEPLEYPFLFIPKVHVRCLICKLQFSTLDVTMPRINTNEISMWKCPHCKSTFARSMGDRISQFLGEDV